VTYDIYEHMHRLASWAASTAARRGSPFSVVHGQAILAEAGFADILQAGLDGLPTLERMDSDHRRWRARVINLAAQRSLNWTHGIAAKLINVYLKVAYVGMFSHKDPRVGALHPPVDRVLLDQLAKTDIAKSRQWRRMCNRGWTNFSSDEYEEVISALRSTLGPGVPLWQIEQWWPGHQVGF
jgi:hypothetical protein